MKSTYILRLVMIIVLAIMLRFTSATLAAQNRIPSLIGTTERVSVSSSGDQGNDGSVDANISADGRFVAYSSLATNLVYGDTNGYYDIFVHDRQTGETSRVSVSSSGVQGNRDSLGTSISADGRYVVYRSDASNLVYGDTNGYGDIFLYDQQTGETTRVSIGSSGGQGNDLSIDSSTSADGRFVTYTSWATNLVYGDTNGYQDAFVHDRQTGETSRVSVSSSGGQGNNKSYMPSISADGRYIAFFSFATNLIYGDTNGYGDVFVHDRQTGETSRVSVSSSGDQGNDTSLSENISADGRFVAYSSWATNLVYGDTNGYMDVFVHDRQTGETLLVSVSSSGGQGNFHSGAADISADGRYIAFDSSATNLVYGDTNGYQDAFVHDRQTGETSRVSVSSSGGQGNSGSYGGSFSADGRFVGFSSFASNLVYEDTNGVDDVFVHERGEVVSDIDLSITQVLPLQVIEGQHLVKDKPTAIKVEVHKTGSSSLSNVQIHLLYGLTLLDRFFVVDPDNWDTNYRLVDDNASFPLDFPTGESEKIIYFFSDSLTPTGQTFQVSANVDPNNLIPEANEDNNIQFSNVVNVIDTTWSDVEFPNLYIHYFRTDWEFNPKWIFNSFMQYSDNFLGAVLPVATSQYSPDHSKFFQGLTFFYRGLDGRLNKDELGEWMRDTSIFMSLAHPTADRFISVMPQGWFAQTTNDGLETAFGLRTSLVPSLVISEARYKNYPNGISIAAHEIGHSYDLAVGCEEYDLCNLDRQDEIGNYAAAGLWVERRIPMQISTNRYIYCFMSGNSDREYWIDFDDYTYLLDDHSSLIDRPPVGVGNSNQVILAAGIFDITGTVTLDNWYVLSEGQLTELQPGPYSFKYLDGLGNTIFEQTFDISFTYDYGSGSGNLDRAPFVFTIPYVTGTSKIDITYNAELLTEKVVSANSPSIQVSTPNGGEVYRDQIMIQWVAQDGDNGSLNYTLLISSDNGLNWDVVAGNITAMEYLWDVSSLPAGAEYLVKGIVTDGFNTTEDTSDAAFTIIGNMYIPLILR